KRTRGQMSDGDKDKRGMLARLFRRGETAQPEPQAPPPEAEAPQQPAPEETAPEAAPETAPQPVRRSWWQRLKEGLARTSSSLGLGITELFSKRRLDAATIDDLEDILIQADLGIETSARITRSIAEGR